MNEKILLVIGNQPITMSQAANIKFLYEVEMSTEYILENYDVSEKIAREIATGLRDYQRDNEVSELQALYHVVIEKNCFGDEIRAKFKEVEHEIF